MVYSESQDMCAWFLVTSVNGDGNADNVVLCTSRDHEKRTRMNYKLVGTAAEISQLKCSGWSRLCLSSVNRVVQGTCIFLTCSCTL